MKQAQDFLDESLALADLLAPLPEAGFATPTLFKQWTVNDILGHLHLFNVAALRSVDSDEAFQAMMVPIVNGMMQGRSLLQMQGPWLNGLQGRALLEAWRQGSEDTAAAFRQVDPKRRLKWAGPDMSALSSITARQMETWAHGQAVFDVLGVQRLEADRIRNIAHLGVSTFGWTFMVRGLPVPQPAPRVMLTGPSGAEWAWNDEQPDNLVRGSAVDFARVVTQTRNVADTDLVVQGETATRWMAMAQCFAGAPENPPAPGTRHAVKR